MLKVIAWLTLAAAAVLCPLAVLAAYDVTGSSSPEPFQTGSGSEAPISATVEIHPETLNLKSHGRWVTAYIELPDGFDVASIDVSTVRLCVGQVTTCSEEASVPAEGHPSSVGDHDRDGIPDLTVKFDRQALIQLLGDQRGETLLTVAGLVEAPGEPFAGSDTIRVIDRGCGSEHAGPCAEEEADEEASEDATAPEATPTPEATAPVEPASAPPGTPSSASPTAEPPEPEPPAAAAPPPPGATVEYTVRPGERLSDVAAFFGTTVETIVALNGLTNANLVTPGQRLLVPAPPASTAPGRAFMAEYVVQPGETLTDIAVRFGTTVEALAAENNLANPSAIRIGDRLRVP
jgi:LysM repeat protein